MWMQIWSPNEPQKTPSRFLQVATWLHFPTSRSCISNYFAELSKTIKRGPIVMYYFCLGWWLHAVHHRKLKLTPWSPLNNSEATMKYLSLAVHLKGQTKDNDQYWLEVLLLRDCHWMQWTKRGSQYAPFRTKLLTSFVTLWLGRPWSISTMRVLKCAKHVTCDFWCRKHSLLHLLMICGVLICHKR